MAFLSVRLAAQSASSTGLRMLALTSLDQQVGSVARFSALATPHQKPHALRNQILSGVGSVSNQHINMTIPSRGITIQEISRNLQMFNKERRNVEKDPNTFQMKVGFDKPTVLIFAWLNAKQKHLAKYAKLYTEQGFEVIVANLTPWQLLWPMKGSQLVASEIVKLLKNNEFKNGLIFHGFSVGGYLWGECLVRIARDLPNHQIILDRVKGQVWDSAADITEIPEGVPRALFPKNPTLQGALRKYMLYHMKAFHEPATSHYIRSSQMFHTNLLRCPALFLTSKTDPVGTELANGRVRDSWESSGVKCTFKCWDRSPHVGHFQKHTAEYIELLFAHLRPLELGGTGLQQTETQLRAKL